MGDDARSSGTTRRYAGLDLLRTLAIVMVVHCHATSFFFGDSAGAYRVLQLGGKGVDLFFVLSGWLLGRQLMQELRDSGRIELRRFWYRRWLRTLPAYYSVLILTLAWQWARGNRSLEWSYFFFGQTYLTDMPYFGISWSLCVEEHFYLMIAPLLWLLWSRRTALILVPVLLSIPLICRTYGWYHHFEETHIRYDPCAMGVMLAAINVGAPQFWERLKCWAPWLAMAGLCAAMRDVICRLNPDWGYGDQGIAAWAFIFGSWVLLAAAKPNWHMPMPGVRYIAERSYAIYLLHIEALSILKKVEGLPFWAFVLLTWAITIPLAEILFRVVERPGMRLRERFSASRSKHR